jgi:protein SCO1/2
MQQLMAGLKRYEKSHPELANKIQPIFISVDPERDNPAVLKQFVSAFHPNLIGLTGNSSEITAVAKSYAVFFDRVPGTNAEDYLMSHTQLPYLMGPKGEPLAPLPVDTPTTEINEGEPDAVAADLEKWVR